MSSNLFSVLDRDAKKVTKGSSKEAGGKKKAVGGDAREPAVVTAAKTAELERAIFGGQSSIAMSGNWADDDESEDEAPPPEDDGWSRVPVSSETQRTSSVYCSREHINDFIRGVVLMGAS